MKKVTKIKAGQMSITIFASLAMLAISGAHAETQSNAVEAHGAGNGGDDAGIQFKNLAREVIASVTAQSSAYPELADVDLSAILDSTNIMATDDPVVVTFNGTHQESVAENLTGPNRIIINRARWAAAPSDDVRRALCLHELIGLAGKESTGVYKISERYLENRGIHCDENLCSIAPTGPFNFKAAQETFQFSDIPTADQLVGTWLPIDQDQDPRLTAHLYLYTGADQNGLPLFQKRYKTDYASDGATNSDYYTGETAAVSFAKLINDLGNASVQAQVTSILRNAQQTSGNSANNQGPYPVNVNPSGTDFSLITSMDDFRNKNQDVCLLNAFSCRRVKNGNLLCSVTREVAEKNKDSNGHYVSVLTGELEKFYNPYTRDGGATNVLVGYILFKKLK